MKTWYVLHCVKLYSLQIQLQYSWDLLNWWDVLFLTIQISSWTLFCFKNQDLVGSSKRFNQRGRQFPKWLIYRMIMTQFFFLKWVHKQSAFMSPDKGLIFQSFLVKHLNSLPLQSSSWPLCWWGWESRKGEKKKRASHSYHNYCFYFIIIFILMLPLSWSPNVQ